MLNVNKFLQHLNMSNDELEGFCRPILLCKVGIFGLLNEEEWCSLND